ncbi:hypothetical protein VNO77_02749 [Canavalia gladiata]|uniref:Uncharacterized protein n=1 Tax=Canavalia gladiata TaxID=3824 RepID=A0AAN9R3A7_CANGL
MLLRSTSMMIVWCTELTFSTDVGQKNKDVHLLWSFEVFIYPPLSSYCIEKLEFFVGLDKAIVKNRVIMFLRSSFLCNLINLSYSFICFTHLFILVLIKNILDQVDVNSPVL